MTGSDEPTVVLPALNEQQTIGPVVGEFLREGLRVLVVDNGSTDATAARAVRAGAEVEGEPRRGYGAACLAGLRRLAHDPPRVVVFADADGSCPPGSVRALAAPIERGEADLVLGVPDRHRAGPVTQLVGNAAVVRALRWLYGVRVRDIPPMRAIGWPSTRLLRLSDANYGLPIETVARGARLGLRIAEVVVPYGRRRGGRSKVGGTVRGTVGAAVRMLWVSLRVRIEPVERTG